MGTDSVPIDTIEFAEPQSGPKRRIRKVDWLSVLAVLDKNPGKWAKIGEFDQSLRSHIRSGRYSYIDPSLYQAITEKIEGKPRNRGMLFMRRVEDS